MQQISHSSLQKFYCPMPKLDTFEKCIFYDISLVERINYILDYN